MSSGTLLEICRAIKLKCFSVRLRLSLGFQSLYFQLSIWLWDFNERKWRFESKFVLMLIYCCVDGVPNLAMVETVDDEKVNTEH